MLRFYSIVTYYVMNLRLRAQRVSKVTIGSVPLGFNFHPLILCNR